MSKKLKAKTGLFWGVAGVKEIGGHISRLVEVHRDRAMAAKRLQELSAADPSWFWAKAPELIEI